MANGSGYAVYFFPQALEVLGEAIKPYLLDGPAGPHVLCHGVDTGGSLIEMSLRGHDGDGAAVELELMVPTGMVRMIASAHSDEVFGFGPHVFRNAGAKVGATGSGGGASAPARKADSDAAFEPPNSAPIAPIGRQA